MGLERFKINSSKVVHETIDGEVIIINLETGAYYNLSGAGLELWSGVEQGASRQRILEVMNRRYPQQPDLVTESLNELLEQMIQEELLLPEPAPEGEGAGFELAAPEEDSEFVAPTLGVHTNMSDLLLLDPIHDVDQQGWPASRQD